MLPTSLDPDLVDACGPTPSWFCEAGWALTGSRSFARAMDWVVTRPLVALVVVVIAALVARWLRRLVTALVERVVMRDQLAAAALGRLGIAVGAETEARERSRARAATLSAVMRAAVSATVWSVAVLMVLAVFDVNLAPLLAGAGIAGIAVGFGAQTLVRDCIAGFFILLEDQFGVGDTVDVGPAIGTVESLTLRTTVVRAVDGTQWTVPNGGILRVGNQSRTWARVAIDVTVPVATDPEVARAALVRAVDQVMADDDRSSGVIATPTVGAIERITAEGLVLRITVRARPDQQDALRGALRRAARDALAGQAIAVSGLSDV